MKILFRAYVAVSVLSAWPATALTDSTDHLQCPADRQIRAEFDNGATWGMCWQSAARENIVLSSAYYQAPGEAPFRVFNSLGLSQLHVSYDDSNIVYNDVTQFGLGGDLIKTLDRSDCPDGELHSIAGVPRLCVSVSDGPDNYQSLSGTSYSESLTVFSTSMVGAYAYIVTWMFFADGSVQPSIGAAGALQRSSDNPDSPYGRSLDGVYDKSWLSHTHNYYWKLDFDLGLSAADDQVAELAFISHADGRRVRRNTVFKHEAARSIDPGRMTSWLISDGDYQTGAPHYLIQPVNYGHKLVTTLNEPYTEYDFFVTRQNDCERFASENSLYYPDCGSNVLEFVNDESIENEDVVVWHRISFHHVPRNEDRYIMHSHWDGFTIEARNLKAATGSGLDIPAELVTPARGAAERQNAAQGAGCSLINHSRNYIALDFLILLFFGLSGILRNRAVLTTPDRNTG